LRTATLGPVASGALPLRTLTLGTGVVAFEPTLVAAGLLGPLWRGASGGLALCCGGGGLLLAIAGPLALLVAARAAPVAPTTLALGPTALLRPAARTPDFDEDFFYGGFSRSFVRLCYFRVRRRVVSVRRAVRHRDAERDAVRLGGQLADGVAYAKRLGAELAVIDKRRSDDGTAEVMNVIGDVAGRTCIIQDDIVDTAGTITKAATALKNNGAERVLACAVHGVLSGPAIERIEKSPIDTMIVTNTIPQTKAAEASSKIHVLSVARLLGQAIKSIHEETSVSSLFV